MTQWMVPCAAAFVAAAASGCSSLLSGGGSAVAGIAGSAVASALTNDAGLATGIGIGVQAAAKTGIQYGQRRVHAEAQQEIARAAGPLRVGKTAGWHVIHSIALEPEESGRVAVSRLISSGELDCKEIVFSVDRSGGKTLPASTFYVASICRSGSQWAWAAAEPATARWGALQ